MSERWADGRTAGRCGTDQRGRAARAAQTGRAATAVGRARSSS